MDPEHNKLRFIFSPSHADGHQGDVMGHDKNGMHDRIPPGGPALVQAQERLLFALGLFAGT